MFLLIKLIFYLFKSTWEFDYASNDRFDQYYINSQDYIIYKSLFWLRFY